MEPNQLNRHNTKAQSLPGSVCALSQEKDESRREEKERRREEKEREKAERAAGAAAGGGSTPAPAGDKAERGEGRAPSAERSRAGAAGGAADGGRERASRVGAVAGLRAANPFSFRIAIQYCCTSLRADVRPVSCRPLP